MWHAIHVQLPGVMVAALAVVLQTGLLLVLVPLIAEISAGSGESATTARRGEPVTAHSTVSQFWWAGNSLSSAFSVVAPWTRATAL